MLASLCKIRFIISRLPLNTAQCNIAVLKEFLIATSAPLSSNNLNTSTDPLIAAVCKAVLLP